jgi:hypothetical protein
MPSGLKNKITDQNIYLKNPLQKNKYFQNFSKISRKIFYLKNPLQKSKNILKIFCSDWTFPPGCGGF